MRRGDRPPRSAGRGAPTRQSLARIGLGYLVLTGLLVVAASPAEAHAGHGGNGSHTCTLLGGCIVNQALSRTVGICAWTDADTHYHYHECGREIRLADP